MGAQALQAGAVEDRTLVQESLDGNQISFQLLVERYQQRLFALARHYTRSQPEMEDIVQESFVKAFRKLDTFQHQSSFATWLYRITVNTALDFQKRRSRSPVKTVEEPERVSSQAAPRVLAPDSRLEREEIARITHEILESLPEIFRTVLVMREFEELSYQDIADVLCISIGTVESRLFRARARFREALVRRHPEFAGREAGA